MIVNHCRLQQKREHPALRLEQLALMRPQPQGIPARPLQITPVFLHEVGLPVGEIFSGVKIANGRTEIGRIDQRLHQLKLVKGGLQQRQILIIMRGITATDILHRLAEALTQHKGIRRNYDMPEMLVHYLNRFVQDALLQLKRTTLDAACRKKIRADPGYTDAENGEEDVQHLNSFLQRLLVETEFHP